MTDADHFKTATVPLCLGTLSSLLFREIATSQLSPTFKLFALTLIIFASFKTLEQIIKNVPNQAAQADAYKQLGKGFGFGMGFRFFYDNVLNNDQPPSTSLTP
jgi:hypothetical protein